MSFIVAVGVVISGNVLNFYEIIQRLIINNKNDSGLSTPSDVDIESDYV